VGAQSDIHHPSVFRFAIGQSVMGWCSQGCQAIVDTGTFLLTVPQQYLSRFLQAVGAQETSYGVRRGVWDQGGVST